MQFPRVLISSVHLLFAGLVLVGSAHAHDYRLGSIEIAHPYARSTAPGQRNGSAYLKLRNGGTSTDRLVAVSSPAAASVEMHSMRMDGDVMRMRELPAVELAAGAAVDLRPGAEHLMLIGLRQPLKAGDSIEMTLQFEKAGRQTVQVPVEAASAATHRH
jgi:periplasmic copper chaperone A